ncbi:HAD family hydrolase (plasmid) [Lachnospiraceae bacterium C1.1]|nr:HAD family hydrolase [Lachnospiraceae bacterium C1.1]
MNKTIVFDLDDTLYDLCWPFQKALEKFYSKREKTITIENDVKIVDEKIEGIFLASRKYSDMIFEEWSSGKISSDDMYAYRNQKAMKDFGLVISREEALEIQSYYKEFQKKIIITENVKEMLSNLKEKNINMAIISNGGKEHQKSKIKTLNIGNWIPDENIFISGEIGYAKPEKKIFDHVIERLAIKKENAWYIGDTFENDIIGAKNAGWNAIWFNRRKVKETDGDIKADIIVKNETEMTQTIKSLFIN